jgi:hypothetical protein
MSCPDCRALDAEAKLLATTICNMSAALLGILVPGMPYEGNPTSVSEAMRLRRAIFILAREVVVAKAAGRYDVDLADVEHEIQRAELAAAADIRIIYKPAEEAPKAFQPGKEPT